MNETERLALVQRWLRYAREDLLAAEAMFGQQIFWPRHACWLAQQAVEKSLKAVLVFLQIDFPRRHDLDEQRNLIPEGWKVKADHPDLAALTEWAVESRYPGDWSDATEEEARVAVQQARAVWESVQADFSRHGIDAEQAA
ncbi:MAG: HEPN domain-containing protein [bacterium]